MKYNRYHNGKIYKIVNNVDDMVYIGSTCLSLSKRKHLHKTEQVSGKSPNRRLFLHTKKYGWDEFDIYLVEQFSCHTKDQLRQREEYHRMQVSPDLCLSEPCLWASAFACGSIASDTAESSPCSPRNTACCTFYDQT